MTPVTNPGFPAARYFLGQIDESVLARDAAALKADERSCHECYESNAYYYAGLKQMADGHKAEALKDFQKVLESPRHMITVPELTHAWIEELNRHPR